MCDWDYINGMADEYGFGDPDADCHDPAGHCGLPFGGGAGGSKRNVYGPVVTCRNCGSRDVYWQRSNGKYVLFNKGDLTMHRCLDSSSKINAEGFDDVV